MQALAELLKASLIPGSESFLLLGTAAGALLIHLREPIARWGRRWLAFLVTLYLLLSSPVIARALEAALILDADTASVSSEFSAIVVLGGGTVTYQSEAGAISEMSDATSLRVLEAVRLYRRLEPRWLVVSGGSATQSVPETVPMTQELIDAGIPADRIQPDPISGSTREQAVNLSGQLRQLGVERFLLVTSPIHMRRALAAFRAQGLPAVPAPSAQHALGSPVLGSGWLPHPAALDASQAAIRELLALGYYWLRGWIRAG